jgi:2'-5' RNA ligase
MTEAVGIRSFVAIPLPADVRVELATAARTLARELPPAVRWSKKPENFHVTLKFLGPIAESRLGELGAAMGGALAGVPRFGLGVRGFGAFPTPGDAKVVFAGLDGDVKALGDVAEVVEGVAATFGIAREARAFTGHVTVGRSKVGVDARAALAPWTDRRFGEVAVDEVHLYESRLGKEGSTYVLRSRATLAALRAPGAN